MEAAAWRTGCSPGLRPARAEFLPPGLSSQENRRTWPGRSVSKGLLSSLRTLCLSGFPGGLGGHGAWHQGSTNLARGRIGGVTDACEGKSSEGGEDTSPPPAPCLRQWLKKGEPRSAGGGTKEKTGSRNSAK